MMVDNVFVLDNGAYTAKVELSKASAPRVIPNCIMKAKSERRRPFIGDQVEECRDASGLFYLLPFQKGFLINWDVQKTVWDYIFSKDCCYINFSETPLIVTEPYFNFSSIQEAMSEIFFEEYECQSLLRVNASCEVKEELKTIVEAEQLHDASPDNMCFFESASYILRYISHKFNHRKDVKRILWEENHNPLLHYSLFSDTNSSRIAVMTCKPLWTRNVCNCPDEQVYLKLDTVLTLHSCLHVHHSKQTNMSHSFESWFSNYLLECEDNDEPVGKPAAQTFYDIIATKLSSLRPGTSTNLEKKHRTESILEKISLEEFCDTNEQPVNYGLKYFEHETSLLLENLEQPVDFSLKYLEEMENEALECVDMMMFGAGETCYAETDLDQTSDVIFTLLEREKAGNRNDESNLDHLSYALSFAEELKEYNVEGTPCDYSMATPLSGICSPAYVDDAKVDSGKVSPNLGRSTNQTNVNKNSEGISLETPLMFSRSSSLSSLTSDEPLNDVRSLISDYSRMASGMISPSDLPDSPTQTTAPSLHSFKLQAPPKLRSVFEEEVSIFREESTPVHFSTTSSLSALSFDDNLLNETANELKPHTLSVGSFEIASFDGNDEDILAACISAGMQKGSKSSAKVKSDTGKLDRSKRNFELLSCIKTPEIDFRKNLSNLNSKSQALDDLTKMFPTEKPPSNISHTSSYSDLSKLPEDSDHVDILAECIQAGMPKSLGKSRCNTKKSSKTSLKLSVPKDDSSLSNQINTTSLLDTYKNPNNTLPHLKSDSTVKVCCCRPNLTLDSPESQDVDCKTDVIKLSRQSSIDSIKEDSTDDPVTLSELLLLEQCITSGMPKKKTR